VASKQKVILGLVIIAAMILLVWAFSGGEKNASTKPVYISSNWTKKYQLGDKNPYGLYLFDRVLDAYQDTIADRKVVYEWKEIDTSKSFLREPKTFVFVGNYFGLHDNEMDSLMNHVMLGSDLFLSYNSLTENLFDHLFYGYQMEFDYSETINVYSDSATYEMVNLYQNDTIAGEWTGFSKLTTIEDYKPLSSFMELENFVVFGYGKGRVYLHTTPKLFQNYQLKRKDGFDYTSYVMSYLDPKRDVYYLELARLSDNIGDFDVDDQSGSEGKEDSSYLRLIFSNPMLLTALLLSILGALLFVIFRSKRMRPVVAYIEPKKDMTIAFTDTITSIYYAKRNPYAILNLMKKNLYNAVHRYFYIDLSNRKNKEVELLAEKTGVSEKEINELLRILETKEASSVSDGFVADAQKKQRSFYRRTGIISDKVIKTTKERKLTLRRGLLIPGLMLLVGLVGVVLGLYYLTAAVAFGIILWPIGTILLVLGGLRISRPYIVVEKGNFWIYGSIYRKRNFEIEALSRIEQLRGGAELQFGENKMIINYWEMGAFDVEQFKRFIEKMEK
jgi:hypothetical protein